MKSFIKTLSIALSSAFLSIFIYNIYFNSASTENSDNSPKPKLIPANYTYTSSNAAAEHSDFTIAAEKTVHAVVHVKNTSSSGTELSDFYRYFYGDDEFPERIGTGSGVIVSPNGYIITNHHVIENNSKIEITTNDNKIYKATVVGSDPNSDIAVLKINTDQELPYVFFGNSDTTKIGEWVLAVGNPFNLNSTVTAGIISAKARDLNQRDGKNEWYIQTDAAVNQGNSGGALVNTLGELIGINTAITSISGGFVGYSFAVPSNIAKKVIEDILEYGIVQYGFLGVKGTSLNSARAKELDVSDTEGFYINGIDKESGAKSAGIKIGDIIKDIDGIKISKFSDLKGYLNTKRPNDIVNINLKRDNESRKVSVQLNRNERINFYLIGILKNMSQKELSEKELNQGVKISEFNSDYKNYWEDYGVKEGDVIKKINGTVINSISDIDKIVKSRNYYDPVTIEILTADNKTERFNFR